jgi:hypothetical protein
MKFQMDLMYLITMKSVDRILGEAEVRPPTEKELTDPSWAYSYAADVIKGRFPEGEATIARDPYWAYNYARDVIKGRWPEGEATIARDPYWSYGYAKYVIKGRFPEGEEAVAKSEYRDKYLESFPDAKDDWLLNGWLDWLDT